VDVHASEHAVRLHAGVDVGGGAGVPRGGGEVAARRPRIEASQHDGAAQQPERDVLHGVGEGEDVERGVDAAQAALLDAGLGAPDVGALDVLRACVLLLVGVAIDDRESADILHARQVADEVRADVAQPGDDDASGRGHSSSGVQP
jgi:hypothetical protein